MNIEGKRSTVAINQDRRIVDMSNEIALLEPEATPLTVLSKRIAGSSKVTKNPKYDNLTDELVPRWDKVNGAVANGTATTITVDNGDYFSVNDLVVVPSTGEQMLVTAISTNDLTVTRGFGGTAAAIADNANLLITGNAMAEGSNAPDSKTTKTVTNTNYTQIFRTPFEVTGTQDASKLYGGADMVYLAKKMGIEHAKTIEEAFLFGHKNKATSGNEVRRSTAGLNSLVTTNRTDTSGTLTETDFEAFLRTAFRYGKKVKTLMASPLLASAINSWGAGKLQTVPADKTFGIALTSYQTIHGKLNIISHNLLEEDYTGMGFLIDTETIGSRFMEGRNTKLKTNIQDNDIDTRKDEYMSEIGFYLTEEKRNAVIEGVTDFS